MLGVPLVKCGTEIFPPDLFELPEGEHSWWVAHVRSRHEKALARYLLPLQIPFYLPLREERSRRSGRSFTSHLPLFPGYVFLRGSGRERHAALRSNLIVRVLDVPDQTLLTRELAELRQLQAMGASLVPYTPIAPGDVVRVADGPFQGYSGVVLRGAARPRLVVSISVLRKTVAVEFERDMVVPVRPARRSAGDVRSAVA
jgi:transcription termination/antitermination protein NusG